MLAAHIQKYKVDTNAILADPLNESLLLTLSKFADLLKLYGHNVELFSQSALLRLPETSDQKKQQMIDFFSNSIQWMQPLNSDIDGSVIYSEKEFVGKALAHYGYTVDDEFWKVIQDNEVTEIYSPEMTQLYRSLNFYGVTSYSLLDLVVNEWYNLWERPKMIIDIMVDYAKDMLGNNVAVKRFKVPKHVLREVLNTTKAEPFIPTASLVEFQYIGAVRSQSSGRPMAFICTAQGEKIAEGQDALNIVFV